MKNSTSKKVQRRSFLKGAAVAGTAMGAGLISKETLAESATEQPQKSASKGYRETDHIREYYRSARF